MRIDVIMPTWNSNAPYFKIVVKRILDIIPISKLIIVDRYSTNGTVDIIKSMISQEKLILVQTNADLAIARSLGISLVTTPVFAFVDSDILLPYGLNVEKYVKMFDDNDKLGVISFSLYSRTDSSPIKILKNIKKVCGSEIIKYGLFQLTAGNLFFSLIRKEAVKGWSPPLNLSALEIFSLTQHVLSKGYLWVEIMHSPLLHLKELKYGTGIRRHLRQGLWIGSNARILGNEIESRVFFLETFSRLFLGTFKKFWTKSPVEAVNNAFLRIGYIIGYLNPNKYRVWVR